MVAVDFMGISLAATDAKHMKKPASKEKAAEENLEKEEVMITWQIRCKTRHNATFGVLTTYLSCFYKGMISKVAVHFVFAKYFRRNGLIAIPGFKSA
jgi:hypothetical protein